MKTEIRANDTWQITNYKLAEVNYKSETWNFEGNDLIAFLNNKICGGNVLKANEPFNN